MNNVITTKFLASTNHRGARIQARCEGTNLTLAYDYGLMDSTNHQNAMLALQEKLGWGHLVFHPGSLPDCVVWVGVDITAP